MSEATTEYSTTKGGDGDSQEVLIVVPIDHDRQLRLHAAERRISRRQLIHSIIAEYLAQHPKYSQQ